MKLLTVATFAALVIITLLAASGNVNDKRSWSFTINGDKEFTVDRPLYDHLVNCSVTLDEVTGVPLEIFLYYYDLYPVISVSMNCHAYDWSELAYNADYYQPFLVLSDGRIYDGKSCYFVDDVEVALAERPVHSTTEIAPSILYAMGIDESPGLINNRSTRVVIFYVDGMGYERYLKAKSPGLIQNITSLGEPIGAVCVYPSVSRVNSKALVTGDRPELQKGDFWSRNPDNVTILEKVTENNMTALWIDGVGTPVNLGNFTVTCPDKNNNGHESDEVTDEAIRRYDAGTNLLFIHYKDPDKKMHSYGPDSLEAVTALELSDAMIGRMLPVLEPGTIVIIYADHGGHTTCKGGNHGTLLPEDMIVPIVVYQKISGRTA